MKNTVSLSFSHFSNYWANYIEHIINTYWLMEGQRIPNKCPMEYRNSLKNYFHTMRFLTLFSSSSFFLLSKEEVTLSCNLQEPKRITYLLHSPNKSSTSIHHTKVAFPCKRVREVIKSFEFMSLRKGSVFHSSRIC